MGRRKRPPKMAPATAYKQESFRPHLEGPKTGPIFGGQKMVPRNAPKMYFEHSKFPSLAVVTEQGPSGTCPRLNAVQTTLETELFEFSLSPCVCLSIINDDSCSEPYVMLNMRVSQCSSHQRCYLNNPTSTPHLHDVHHDVGDAAANVLTPPTPHVRNVDHDGDNAFGLGPACKNKSSTQECFQNKVFPSVQSNKIVFGVTLVAACEPNKHPWEPPINASAPKNHCQN